MNMIFDTHAHYDDEAFDADRDELLETLFSTGGVCAAVDQGTTVETSKKALELAHRFDGIYAAVGIHPECIDENSLSELSVIRELAADPQAVAIGEIGLDYYYDTPRELQKEVFRAQIIMANELGMPVTIHDREAHGDTLDIITELRPKGILHCFSGSFEMAKRVVSMGMYIGIGGVVTFRNARKTVEVAEGIPHDFIVLETDCPYLAPVPFRGKRNDSGMIIHTAAKLAEIWGVGTEEVLRITKANAEKVYFGR